MQSSEIDDLPPETTRALAGRLLRGGPLPSDVPHLEILTGPAVGETAPLDGGLTLGRGPAASCRIRDPSTSRLHARVERRGNCEVLVDLGSKNGVRLNGRPLRRERRLRHGDRIEIGETELKVVCPTPTPTATANSTGVPPATTGLPSPSQGEGQGGAAYRKSWSPSPIPSRATGGEESSMIFGKDTSGSGVNARSSGLLLAAALLAFAAALWLAC